MPELRNVNVDEALAIVNGRACCWTFERTTNGRPATPPALCTLPSVKFLITWMISPKTVQSSASVVQECDPPAPPPSSSKMALTQSTLRAGCWRGPTKANPWLVTLSRQASFNLDQSLRRARNESVEESIDGETKTIVTFACDQFRSVRHHVRVALQ